MNEELTMTTGELTDLKEVYGEDDPDIQEALAMTDPSDWAPQKSQEKMPEDAASPAEMGDEAAVSAEEDTMNRQYSNSKVPLAALHEERRKRQEASQRAQQLEAELSQWRSRQGESRPRRPAPGSVEDFIGTPPGKVAKQLFMQEQRMEYDPYNPEHQERLQELTSLVTLKQFQTGEMYRQVQAERANFSREVLAWRDEILAKPEVEYRAMERFAQMPDSAQKRILQASWERLVAGQASRDEFELIREFSAETERQLRGAKGSPARIAAAMNLPRTADIKGGSGMKGDPGLDLIERKLDRGEKLAPEEENWIKNLT